ncbi:hypothetical protein AUK40_03420 [Candidatus Wirthbacteria bacterium CG2_30_54_11]|uniref:Uncharacterized protein n=1 Tax=Candidatus Wirthbacteria bacterium CG2_30_54_11 TaxID=1817892 RepID=A0A1J5IJS8_9BACT|nr:MAG: hypothetical protein AUK40_03420 [Candidatus Wirthbacteria bacterium CG2_30_54_11]
MSGFVFEIGLGFLVLMFLIGIVIRSVLFLPRRSAEQPENPVRKTLQQKQTETSDEHEKKKRSLTRKARQAVKKGIFQAAEDFLFQASGVGDDDPRLLRDLATAMLGQGKLDKARVTLEKLTRLEPTEENMLLLGQVLCELSSTSSNKEHVHNSLFCYQSILKKNPGSVQGLIGIAKAYEVLGRYDDAFLSYHQAFELDPNQIEIGLRVAQEYERKHMMTELEQTIDTLSTYHPQDEAVGLRRVKFLFLKKDHLALVGETARMLALYPDSPEFIRYAGLGAYHLNRFQEAVEYLTTLSQADPGKAVNHYNLALAYIGLQQYDEAASSVQKAVDLASDVSKFHFLLGKVYLWKGDTEQAAKALSRAVALDPDNFEALSELKRIS